MDKSVAFVRIIKYGLLNFWRYRWLSTTALLVTTISLLVFSGLLAINQVATITAQSLKSKVNISVFFSKDVTSETIKEITAEIEKIDEVRSTKYISAEQALADFKSRHADDPLIQKTLDQLKDNPLESSLVVSAKELDQYPVVISKLERSRFQPLFKSINFADNQKLIDILQRVTRGIRNFGFLLVALFSSVSILVMFNTLRLTIFSRREEIEIMRLVGAFNWYIRGPFILEGVLYGLFGTIIASALLFPAMRLLSPQIMHFFGIPLDAGTYFSWGFWKLGLLQLGFGVALGIASSIIATRKHLKI
ncbi:MAG: permease-like cell division protein FtsX [bacterium]|nr:permease-like cell division protein FtsX [bacterium]